MHVINGYYLMMDAELSQLWLWDDKIRVKRLALRIMNEFEDILKMNPSLTASFP